MSGNRSSWGELKRRLDAAGFRPSRQRGQNFLVDDGICRKIATAGRVEEGETVLEVGVGLGFLTRHLLDAGAQVVGVEIDPRLASIARSEVDGDGDASLSILETDVLESKHELSPVVVAGLPAEGPWSVVANLPYAVSSSVVVLLSRLDNPPRAMTLLVQAEVADRLCAAPGESAWGAVSARVQLVYQAQPLFRVPAQAFRPRPKVESGVVRLERASERPPRHRVERFDALLGALFPQRRKRVRTPLGAYLGGLDQADALLARVGLPTEVRVDQLSTDQWMLLADAAEPA